MTREEVKILKEMIWTMVVRLPENWQKEDWFKQGKQVIDKLKADKAKAK